VANQRGLINSLLSIPNSEQHRLQQKHEVSSVCSCSCRVSACNPGRCVICQLCPQDAVLLQHAVEKARGSEVEVLGTEAGSQGLRWQSPCQHATPVLMQAFFCIMSVPAAPQILVSFFTFALIHSLTPLPHNHTLTTRSLSLTHPHEHPLQSLLAHSH